MEWMAFTLMDEWKLQSEDGMAKKTIEQLCAAKYDDPDVAAFVAQLVKEAATGDKILSGERVLPSVEDATRNYQIANGVYFSTETERQQADKIGALEARLKKLESMGHENQPKGA